MNLIQKSKIFSNEEFGNIRTILIDNKPWFCGKDIANALKYKHAFDALRQHVYPEDKQIIPFTTDNILGIPPRGMVYINESGLYSLILGSKLSSAKKFKHWVTHDVLPNIRILKKYELNDSTQPHTLAEGRA